MKTIEEIKAKSGAKMFASVMGKSTIDKDSEEYKMIEQAVEVLINHGYGIIHGGYAGGAMSAASDTANRLIKERGLPKELNIGVPQVEHDGLWERVENASFTEVAEDIFTRLKIVASGDIVVIAPLGGDGTELEETIIFHENVVREGIKKYTKDQSREFKKPTPLIFLLTKNGTDWKTIINTKITLLDTSATNSDDHSWIYFVDSLDKFEQLVGSF